ncbi:acyl-ACP--UDP-N-acetylglucosamine O-acyltransferase [Candidatus Pelagibacter sp.]|nr:acyl-ACP--UDP-N-acetylglucosamine O-acyltransferase [Candidatus Pelagibacter sp.]MDA9754801.1 acyl-ACP--UDP-N-acetylglucosamine O-acyltransferase [Candidatus Pelagibacter sp.]
MIHKTAIIDSNAKISKDVKIGPYTVIGPNVEIGEDTEIQSHVYISGNTKIGKNNKIYAFASIGNDPQDLKFKGEETKLEIGNNNKIREYVTINPGTSGGGGLTKVGNNCLFMVSSHVAHDCCVGNNVILANNVPLGGHAHVDDNAIIGGNSAVQQFTRVGKSAMIGGMCGVVRDIIPYGIAHGNRSILKGLNIIGLRRKNIPNKEIMTLSDAYNEIFKNENFTENLNNLSKDFRSNKLVAEVVEFIERDKKRPICTPFSK